jgi:hypothetical protein
MATEAGQGEHHVYRIVPTNSSDTGKLTRDVHYVGIDAVSWYINKKSTWFTDRLSSGTLDIKLADGLEKYQAALGTFELKGGSKFAPVFDRSVLPDRNYRGGKITLTASLTSIKKTTAIGGMLMSAASASLGVVAGMVNTASLAGPAKMLSAAGEDLIGGVKKVLADTGEKREPLFDFSGLEKGLSPDDIVGPEVFILLHRGAELAEQNLKVRTQGQMVLPHYNNAPLDDGAWLLLRIRRSSVYSSARDWFDSTRALRNNISNLVSDVGSGVVTKEEALKKLKPSADGGTLFDEFVKLRSIIQHDGVLTEAEAGLYVGQLKTALDAAQRAISQNNPTLFTDAMKELRESLLSGTKTKSRVVKSFDQELSALTEFRRSASGKRKGPKGAEPPASALFEHMPSLSKAIKKYVVS